MKIRGLAKIQFHDYNKAFSVYELPNLTIFKEQINTFKEMLVKAPAGKEQMKDIIPFGQNMYMRLMANMK